MRTLMVVLCLPVYSPGVACVHLVLRWQESGALSALKAFLKYKTTSSKKFYYISELTGSKRNFWGKNKQKNT